MATSNKHVNSIDIRFDQETLATVVAVFNHILENDDEIDFSMMDLASLEDLETLTRRLTTYVDNGQAFVTITLHFDEWVTYNPYVWHSWNDCLISNAQKQVMEKLSLENSEYRRAGLTPVGP